MGCNRIQDYKINKIILTTGLSTALTHSMNMSVTGYENKLYRTPIIDNISFVTLHQIWQDYVRTDLYFVYITFSSSATM